MKKSLLISSLIGAVYLSPAFALQQPPQPQKCPSASAIQAVGVSRTVIETSNLWFTGRRHQNYDTTDAWTFVLGNIVATGANDAYNKAVVGLTSLSFPTGPMVGPLSKWLCLYTTLEGYTGVAITTPIALNQAQAYLAR